MKYILLNETGYTSHQGCRTVSRVIARQMKSRGFQLAAAERGGADWGNNSQFLRAVRSAELILINGEGTMHSGSPAATDIMRFVSEVGDGAAPIAFINTIWERNPAEWSETLKRAEIVAARDTASQKALVDQGVQARFVPDLSLSAYASGPHQVELSGIGWCDSVNKKIAAQLMRLSVQRKEPFLPVQSSHRHLDYRPASALRRVSDTTNHRLRTILKFFRVPDVRLFQTPEEYFCAISSLELLVTGRFHGACLAIEAGVPFLALTSNTHKIEQLIQDAGLDPHRVVPLDELEHQITSRDWRYSHQEEENRTAFLARAKADTERLFDDICGLVTKRRENSANKWLSS